MGQTQANHLQRIQRLGASQISFNLEAPAPLITLSLTSTQKTQSIFEGLTLQITLRRTAVIKMPACLLVFKRTLFKKFYFWQRLL